MACAACHGGPQPEQPWTCLFDGETLGAFVATEFGGEGAVLVEGGRLVLESGSPLTGVTWSGDLPRTDYEIELGAARLSGTDFFLGLTFPVGPSCCTLILGGWGGSLVGLSNIDDADASENETRRHIGFEDGVRYAVRVRVTPARIRAWLDDVEIVNQPLAGRRVSIRPEVTLSRPFGIATFATTAAYENIRIRKVSGS